MQSTTELKQEIFLLNNKLDMLVKNLCPQTDCNYTFFVWLDLWYEIYKSKDLKQSSLNSIKFCINKHIKQNMQDVLLVCLTAIEIQCCLNKIESTRMRKYTYDVFNACLRKARQLEYIYKDIMLCVNKVRHTRVNGKALTYNEQKLFLKHIGGNTLENLYKFYLFTGCRKSEALNLKWQDINFENKTMKIWGTKTKQSVRVIPLTTKCEKLLKDMGSKKQGIVFAYNVNMVSCNFKRLSKRYRYNFTIHSLRHTFATRCLENGISMKIVQKWLGHARYDTTANIYMHIQTKFEKQEIDKLNTI